MGLYSDDNPDPTQQNSAARPVSFKMNPLIPPGGLMSQPPIPPSPSLGFSIWAQDPANNMKVQHSMTAPNAPLQPGANAVVQPSNAVPEAKPFGYYASHPPQTAMERAVTPPGGFRQQLADTSANVNAAPSAEVTTPTLLPQSAPQLLPPTAAPRVQSPVDVDQARLQQLQAQGAGLNKIQNPVLRTLARIGDVAGSIVAPGIAAEVPGTTNHNLLLQQRQKGVIAQDQQALQADMQQRTDQANLAHTQTETAAIPLNAGLKRQQYLAALAGKGLMEDASTGAIVPDEASPVYQQEQVKESLIQAQTDNYRAQQELRTAQTEYNKAKIDPNSPLFKQTAQRLATAQQNANAAGQRAQAYMGRYMQSAYNVGLDGKVLPGATTIADDNGDTTTVGTGNAPLATKNQSNAAQFNDVHGALDNLEGAARQLVAKGGSLNSPRIAAALAQPAGTLGQWLQGAGVKAGLTPEERQYVQSVASAHENIQALRKSAGGTATDSAVAKLDSMIPGASTPDLNYLLGQTGQIRATATRLGKGATTAQGGLTVRGQQPANPAASGVRVFNDAGVTYHIPAAQVAAFQKDHPNAR